MARNRLPFIATLITLFIFFSYVLLPSSSSKKSTYSSPSSITTKEATTALKTVNSGGFAIAPDSVAPEVGLAGKKISEELLHGNTIMPKLGNETIKAELGRASWKLLHTTLARYPKKPTPDERQALHTYLLLFARLYPCGECATHFQKLLTLYPPQTSSRDAASQWGCHIHNLVNERLRKPEFDCGSVTEAYKCGCAEADVEAVKGTKTVGDSVDGDRMERSTVGITVGRPLTAAEDVDLLEENTRGARVEVLRDG